MAASSHYCFFEQNTRTKLFSPYSVQRWKREFVSDVANASPDNNSAFSILHLIARHDELIQKDMTRRFFERESWTGVMLTRSESGGGACEFGSASSNRNSDDGVELKREWFMRIEFAGYAQSQCRIRDFGRDGGKWNGDDGELVSDGKGIEQKNVCDK
ncbi:hypothetical protein BLNAU_4362 [Blattamonas nauphoetae]|uniref:Uncharacterized protein n=1 Tax=Blattamonas nauphoetae TaxID=2049346 RepID=A0ABQ9YAA8_9EUKA|nr:hypothetical protein BLNAU_4362 [Blattamonas nauphoetae]